VTRKHQYMKPEQPRKWIRGDYGYTRIYGT